MTVNYLWNGVIKERQRNHDVTETGEASKVAERAIQGQLCSISCRAQYS